MSEKDLNRRLEDLFSDVGDPLKAIEPPDLLAATAEGPLGAEEQAAVLRTLRESEQKFRTLYEATSDAVMLLDERNFFDCNPATLKVFGCMTKEQFLGKHPSEFSPLLQPNGQDSVSLSQQRITMALQEGSCRFEWLHCRLDGSEFPAEVWLTSMEIGGKKVLQAVVRDISERKRAEEALAEERRLLRTLIDSLPDYIFVKDVESRFVINNIAHLQQALGVTSQEEAVGKTDFDIFPRELADQYYADEQEVVRTGQPLASREEPITEQGTGTEKWLSTTKVPLHDSHGKIMGLVGISRDITDRKQLEQQIQASLERRGQQVQISTQVAQEIAAAPGLDELFRRVVTLIKERFGYYHVQIFRYEPTLEAVVLVTGYGEAGQKMLSRGYRPEMGRGVVGTAAATGQPILATDVAQDKDWRPNPDLPETKSELAVPIKLRDRVLGILDVQSNQVGALTEDDELLLEGLCGQIAIAIEDTRLRQETEERLHELDSMYRAMSREGWETLRQTARQSLPTGYLFDRVAIQPADDLWMPEIRLAVEQDALVPPTSQADARTEASGGVAVAPLSVHGEVVGILGVYDDPQQPLSPDDLTLVESVSEQVALALESARLFQQTQAALSESENLYQISAGLNAARTYEDILAALRTHTVIGEANQSGIFLFDHGWEDEIPEKANMLAGWADEGEIPASLQEIRLQDSPVAQILRRDEPVWVEDVSKDDRLNAAAHALYESLGMRAVFFIPLVAESRWIGFLSGGWREPAAADPALLRRLMAMAGQAAVAVQNLQRLQEIQIRAQREQALREIVAVINASENLGASLPTINGQLCKLIPLSFSALTTYTPGEHECIVFTAGAETEAGAIAQHGIRVPLEGTGSGWVITHQKPWLEADMRSKRSFTEDDRLIGQGVVSRLILPLQLGERVIGTFTLGSELVGAFTEEATLILNQIADQMALVLERVRLAEETRTALAETEAVYRRYLRQEWESFLGRAGSRNTAYIDSPTGLVATQEILMPEIEQAIASGEPVILAEQGKGASQPAPRAALAMPIRLRGQTIGALDFYQEGQEWTWTDEERALVETLADQVALALENARLFTETRASAQQMQTLYETSRALSSALEQDAIIRTVLGAIYRTMGCEYLTISLVDEQTSMIETRHGLWQGEYDVFPEWMRLSRYPLDHTDILADIYRTGRTEVIGEWDDRFNREIWSKFGHERLLRIFMPLKVRDRVLGVIEVGYDKHQKGQIDKEEIQTLTAFVDQAAVALENANLLQQAQRRAWREGLAREIAGKIQAAPDVETVLQTAVRELGRIIGTPRSFVQLGGADQGER